MSEWVKRFGLVKSTVTLEENPIITQQVMDQELALENRALLLQSTRKRKLTESTAIVPSYALTHDLTKFNEDNLSSQDVIQLIAS